MTGPYLVKRRLAFVATLLCLPLCAILAGAEAAKTSFDLPSDILENSIKRFAAQSGLEVLILSDAHGAVRTRAVRGLMTIRQALDTMLAGTELTVLQDPKTGAFSVRKGSSNRSAPKRKRGAQTATGDRPTNQRRTAPDESVRATGPPAVFAKRLNDDDDPTKLSPFEVRGDRSPFEVRGDTDRGYYGANTMSGTRLNSTLEDLAASITIVTKQQMTDFSTVDINDIFLYEANTEGLWNFTDYSVDRSGTFQDESSSITNPGSGNRVRGLSGANIALDGFARNTIAATPVDSYNIDAVEISRGPNSNIFGLGEGSGTVNIISSLARLGRTSSQLTLRTDREGGVRSSFDLNRSVGKTLAVRLLGLYDDKGFTRKPSSDVTRRGQLALTFKPFKKTTIRASYESYKNFARRPNIVTPTDFVSDWIDAGRPTWDPIAVTSKIDGVSMGSQLPRGLGVRSNNPVRFVEGDQVTLWTVARLSNTANPNTLNSNIRFVESVSDIWKFSSTSPLFRRKGISDKSLYDWESINVTAPNYQFAKSDTYRLDIEQFILDTPTHLLAVKLGAMREDADNYKHLIFSGGQDVMTNEIMIDVNEKLLDGSPNPFFLRPYLRGNATRVRGRADVSDTSRAQLAYQLDLTKQKNLLSWLGRHRISAYGEFIDGYMEQQDWEERVLSDHTWTNNANRSRGTAAGGNGSVVRYYLGDNQGNNIDYGPAPLFNQAGVQNFYWRNGVTGDWISEPALWGETPSGGQALRRQVRTEGLSVQSYFFGERLVTTFGWRYDRNRSASNSRWMVLDSATGVRRFDPRFINRPWVDRSGRTNTQGGVVRPLRGLGFLDRMAAAGGLGGSFAGTARSLSFHYNKADSFVPAVAGYNIMRELQDNPVSKGEDYGFAFTLLQEKLYFKFNKYQTLVLGKRDNDLRSLANYFHHYDFKGSADRPNALEAFAENVISGRFAGQGVTPTPEQFQVEVYKFMQMPESLTTEIIPGFTSVETVDARGRGLELELNYNPTWYWTIKMNATRQAAVDMNLSGAVQRYIALRMPAWLSIEDDQGVKWWEVSGAARRFAGDNAALEVALAQEGKPRTQVRKWRFNALTSFDFAGLDSDHEWLGNLTVGGAVRWEDRGSIGFYGEPADPDGVIRRLDKHRPIWDPSRFHFDAFARYQLRLFENNVRASVQLNVRNLSEDGGLRAVGANPNGSAYAFRIIDPRTFTLTATFDF